MRPRQHLDRLAFFLAQPFHRFQYLRNELLLTSLPYLFVPQFVIPHSGPVGNSHLLCGISRTHGVIDECTLQCIELLFGQFGHRTKKITRGEREQTSSVARIGRVISQNRLAPYNMH